MVYFDVHLILPLVANYGDTCEDIMLGAFGVKKPRQWQKEAFSHQFHMMKKLLVNKQLCFPSILCVPTGGGKSLLWDICAISIGGVMLCVSPLLLLSADQITKKFHKRKDRFRSFIPIWYSTGQIYDLKPVLKSIDYVCTSSIVQLANNKLSSYSSLLNQSWIPNNTGLT